MTRSFEDYEAKRSRVPLMIGLYGASGSGKTFSALRLASGIQRVTGGDIYVIDTEARRALHYADRFKFRHVPFGAPFGPLDYLEAINYCANKGAKIVVVDSSSHEHEGPGGVLEMHQKEVERLSGGNAAKAEKVKMLAWAKPKAERRRLINTILQLPVSSIFCFRAKEKIKIVPGKDPQTLGFMPIAGEEFIYEMTTTCLLMPNAGGIPSWYPKEDGEKTMIKLPEQFRQLFADSVPLSEDLGESFAKWAEGGPVSRFGELVLEIERAGAAELEAVVPKIEEAKKRRTINEAERMALRSAFGTRKKALGEAAKPPSNPGMTDEERVGAIDHGTDERQPGED